MTRPIIDQSLTRLTAEISRIVPELSHVAAERVLFIAGAARLAARASIRPFVSEGGTGEKPVIEIDGVRMLYEICLRPLFFLEATPRERIAIIIHELWHASPSFDGTLDSTRRHAALPRPVIEEAVEGLVERFLARCDAKVGQFLEREGEMRMRAWRVRPPSRIPPKSGLRTRYDARDLFLAVVGGKGTADV